MLAVRGGELVECSTACVAVPLGRVKVVRGIVERPSGEEVPPDDDG